MNEWISVEDRLPEVGVPVLGYDGGYFNYPYNNKITVVSFLGKYDFYTSEEEEAASKWPLFEIVEDKNRTGNFTHWMPLPEPPKDLTKEAD